MSLGIRNFFLALIFFSTSIVAEPITGKAAKLKLLDKVTNKVSQKIVEVDTHVEWGSLSIQVYVCYSTPPEEVPENYVLIEVKDLLDLENDYLYRGWMISSAPDITPLEHPIYDLWLIECRVDSIS